MVLESKVLIISFFINKESISCSHVDIISIMKVNLRMVEDYQETCVH